MTDNDLTILASKDHPMTDKALLERLREALERCEPPRDKLYAFVDGDDLRETIDTFQALEASLAQVTRERDWRPIETAPKDRKVLAGYWNVLGNWRTVTACYYTQLPWSDGYDQPEDAGEYAPEGWYEETETHETLLLLDTTPTHWQPLPAALTANTEQEK